MLKNPLQIAKQAFCAASRYKARQVPTVAAIQQATTPFATSKPTSIPTSLRHSYSTTTTMASTKSFLDAIKERRTYYALNKQAPISDKEIQDITKEVVLHVPSSFNSQSARVVLLLNKEHDTFWDFVLEVLKPMVPAEQFGATEQKIGGFKAGYGTVSCPFQPRSLDADVARCLPQSPTSRSTQTFQHRLRDSTSSFTEPRDSKLTSVIRLSSSRTLSPSRPWRRPSPSTPPTSPSGASTPPPCISSPCGPRSRPPASAPPCSTTTLSSIARRRSTGRSLLSGSCAPSWFLVAVLASLARSSLSRLRSACLCMVRRSRVCVS